mmetsp:Transcript_29981/g.86251  ORF Transcript_29981/g.86251 Transcript_29981/m.86251 type:complete len:481 (+) Transcript_29981:1945-3387(+)
MALLDAAADVLVAAIVRSAALRRDASGVDVAGDLPVGETAALRLAEQRLALAELGEIHGSERRPQVVDVVQLGQEPAINLRELVNPIDRHSHLVGLGDAPDAGRRRFLQLVDHCGLGVRGVPVHQLRIEALGLEAATTLVDHAKRLLDHLLKSAPDGHHLADAFHARPDGLVDRRELAQVPTRHLRDDVVEGWLEACRRHAGHAVPQADKVVPQRQLRSDVGERIARRLRSQGTASGQPGVHLDDPELLAVGVHGVLDVALADNAQMPHHLERALAQPEVLLVGQCLRRRDDDGIAGVDAHRVEVLHVTDRDAVIGGIAYHLVLKLLPSLQALVHDHLRAVDQGLVNQRSQLRLIGGEPAAQAAEGVGRANEHRVADLGGRGHGFIHRAATSALRHLVAAMVHSSGEELAVLGEVDRLDGGTHDPHVVLLEDAGLVHLHRAVQSRLSAEGAENAVRALALDDLSDELGGHRQEVHTVCIA